MRVLVLSHMYPSIANEVAGIFVHKQVRALIDRGIEVRVVSPVPVSPFPLKMLRNKWLGYSKVPDKDYIDGIEVHYPRYISFPQSLFFEYKGWLMHRGMKGLLDSVYATFPFDLIHAHVAIPGGLAAVYANKKFAKPLLVTVHGMDMSWTVHRSRRCRTQLSTVFSRADRIITVSDKLKREAAAKIGYAAKIITIHNGVNPAEACDQRSLVESEHQKKVVLSAANLIEKKGIALNIRAIAMLLRDNPGLKYIVVGSGIEEGRLKKLVRKLGVEKSVEFLGSLPHEKVMRYMSSCDVFSMPSWEEGFGVVYLEAMMHGKPVIGTIGEGIEDVVTHEETGFLVKRQDVDDLRRTLASILGDSSYARAIGEKARELVLGRYTWDHNAAEHIKLYRDIIQGQMN